MTVDNPVNSMGRQEFLQLMPNDTWAEKRSGLDLSVLPTEHGRLDICKPAGHAKVGDEMKVSSIREVTRTEEAGAKADLLQTSSAGFVCNVDSRCLQHINQYTRR